MTEEKTITRENVTKAAKAWVDAELALAHCDEWSSRKQAALSERCDDARDEFERLLDAWRDQQVERARASAIAEIDHERTVW